MLPSQNPINLNPSGYQGGNDQLPNGWNKDPWVKAILKVGGGYAIYKEIAEYLNNLRTDHPFTTHYDPTVPTFKQGKK